jgi:hypothetical protein
MHAATRFSFARPSYSILRPRALACAFLAAGVIGVPALAGAQDTRMYGYRTQPGDNLMRIASRFLLDTSEWKSLQRLNNIKNPHAMPEGKVVNIPTNAMRTVSAPATVVAVQGSVKANGNAAQLGASVREGDRLTTGDDGFVTIRLADGSTLTVQSKSAVKVENARQLVNTGGVGDSIVRLESGRLETTVAKQRDPASRYEIRTPTSNMGVRGTVFRVAADETGIRAASEVLEGKVAVSSANAVSEGVALTQGFGTVAEKDKPPLQPIPLLPAPDVSRLPAEVDDISVAFEFEPVAKAVKYRGQLARDAEFTQPVADTVAATPSIRFAQVAPGNYFVRLRAIDGLGLEGNNGSHRVTVSKQLPAPVLSSALRDSAAPFSWANVPGAKGYRLEVAQDEKFAKLTINDANIKTNSFTPAAPLAPGNYVWRVVALGDSGRASAPSATSSFSIAAPAPVLSHRTIGGHAGPLAWTSGAQEFQVQIAHDDTFQKIVVDRVVRDKTFNVDELRRGLYFARVRAAGGYGAWSEMQNFEIYRGR